MLALIIDDEKIGQKIGAKGEIEQKILLNRASANNQIGGAAHGIPRQIRCDV